MSTINRHARRAARRAGRYTTRHTRHTARALAHRALPVARLALHSPIGAGRIASGLARFVFDPAGRQALHTMANTPEHAGRYQTAMTGRAAGIAGRGCLTVTGLTLGWLAAGMTVAHFVPSWAFWPLVAAVVVGLGWYGTRPKTPAAGPAAPLTDQRVTRLSRAIEAALPAVRTAAQNQPGALKVGPFTPDGPGQSVTVTLPVGVAASAMIRASEQIAAGIGKAADQVTISPDPGHAGRAVVWIADRPVSSLPAPRWALADSDRFDLTDPLPVGETERGEPVQVSLKDGSLLVGGKPGFGKTALMRQVLAAAALDPRATIAIFDGKGRGDYAALEPAAAWVRVGDSPENLTDLEAMLTAAQDHMRAVFAARDSDPDPLVIAIDEAQVALKTKTIAALVEDLVRRGRAARVIVLLSTQRPTADSIPSAIRDNCAARVCLKVSSHVAVDSILGSGAYADGLDATRFSEDDKGLAWVIAEGIEGRVRLALVSDSTAGKIARRHARAGAGIFEATRPPAGRSAAPAGDPPPEPSPAAQGPRAWPTMADQAPAPDPDPVVIEGELIDEDGQHSDHGDQGGGIIEAVLAVWPDGRDRAATAELAALLAILGGRYAGWQAADVTRALKGAGVEPRTLKLAGRAVRGVYRADCEAVRGVGGR